MSVFRKLQEAAAAHPMAVHAFPVGDGKFKVAKVGSKVKHVSPGDTISSSDLDDLSDAGHKVREIKKPMKEGWIHIGPAGSKSPYTSFGSKKPGTVTLGDDGKWAKKDKEPAGTTRKTINDRLTTVKSEEVEHIEEGMPSGVIKDKAKLAAMSNKEFAEKYKNSTEDSLRAKARTHGIKNINHYINRRSAGLADASDSDNQVDEALGTMKNIKAATKFSQSNIAKMDREERARKKAKEDYSKMRKDMGMDDKATTRKIVGEDIEQIDEISPALLSKASKAASDKAITLKQKSNQKVKDMSMMTDRETNTIVKGKEKEADDLSKQINVDRDMADKKAKQSSLFARIAAKKQNKNDVKQVDESGLSTKTLANYSVKASAATTDKKLPANKTRNRYAGVSRVDKILSLRDKKKVD